MCVRPAVSCVVATLQMATLQMATLPDASLDYYATRGIKLMRAFDGLVFGSFASTAASLLKKGSFVGAW